MKRILLVEDDRTLRETFHDIMVFEGYAVDAVANGTEALKYLETKTVDLILSDVRMPSMGGIELLHQLKKQRSKMTPVILISGYAEEFTREMAIESGAADLLSKPIDVDEFLEKIKFHCTL